MAYEVKNLFEGNPNIRCTDQKGPFWLYEHAKDMSVSTMASASAYYASQMNVHKRQVMCQLNNNSVRVQAGAMQWMIGNVQAATGVKSVGGFLGNALKGAVTGEAGIKPEYGGFGYMMLEPSFKHIIFTDLTQDWGGAVVTDDGMFLACESTIDVTAAARRNVSSAVLGGEGLFNPLLRGSGIAALESPCPREELIVFNLNNDVLKIDGNMAVAWSNSLEFTVERTTKTLIGSAASGEGLVNTYRGTGTVWMAPVA